MQQFLSMMDEERHMKDGYEGKSAGQMLAEVARLLLLLLLSMLKWLGRLLLRGLKLLLKLVCKGLLWLIDATGRGIERLQAFWNDNDTQEKLRKLREGTVAAGRQLWQWTVVAAKATWRGLVWMGRNTAKGAVWLARRPRTEVCCMCLCKMAATAVARPAQMASRPCTCLEAFQKE